MKNLPHTIDGRQVDAKRAIPHAIHQVYAPQPVAEPFSIQGEAFIPPFENDRGSFLTPFESA